MAGSCGHENCRRRCDAARGLGARGSAACDSTSGRVAPRGTMTLTPPVTTTYTLSVTGPSNSADKRTVTVVVQGTTANATASDASINRPKTVPRTADGHPDFSGVYGYGAGGGGRGAAPAPAAPGSLPT